VEYGFTAALEDDLDAIANGKKEWKKELRLFWDAFSKRIEESKTLKITDVLQAVEEVLAPYIFGTGEAATFPRICPTCNKGELHLKTGKFGAFLGCSNYPECNFTRQLVAVTDAPDDAADASASAVIPRALGVDPVSGEPVSLRKGPYGVYVQLGESAKPKRAGLPKGVSVDGFTLDSRFILLVPLSPRDVGLHPETGKMVKAGSRPLRCEDVVHDGQYANLPASEERVECGHEPRRDIACRKPPKEKPKTVAVALAEKEKAKMMRPKAATRWQNPNRQKARKRRPKKQPRPKNVAKAPKPAAKTGAKPKKAAPRS